MKIYALSGLGADQRVFQFLNIEHQLIPLIWKTPFKDESIESYSERLAEKMDTSEDFALLGVSFGGLVAIEISKILSPKTTILISSIETKNDLKPIYRFFAKTNSIDLIPSLFFKPPLALMCYLFGTNQKKLLGDILNDTDLMFAKWATKELINWKNNVVLDSVLKISGSKDKLLSSSIDAKTKNVIDGEHFMIVDRADEISEIINSFLEQL